MREFQRRPRETFLYTCGAIDLWEWECRLMDQEPGQDGDTAPLCLGGRGAAPPEHGGGPTGYRLMRKRQNQGEAMCTPVQREAVIGRLSAADPGEPARIWDLLRSALQDGFQNIDRRWQEYGPLEPERFSLQEAQPTPSQTPGAHEVPRMKFRVEVICLHNDGEQRCSVMEVERAELAMETLGLSVAEGQAMLHGVQDLVVSQQAQEDLKRRRKCPAGGQPHHSKQAGTHTVNTVFGPVAVPNPRWHRCPCQSEGPKTFRPTAAWLQGRTSPERLYLETKWASLIPFAKVANLLQEVLPVSQTTDDESVREHLQAVAERREGELGEERQAQWGKSSFPLTVPETEF